MILKNNIKKAILFVAFTTILSASFAQEDPSVKKGTFAFDIHYGIPNMLIPFVKSAFQQESYLKHYHFRNIGPFGIRGEYFILDHIAFSIEANYSLTHILWEEPYEYLDEQGNNVRTLNYCDYSVTRYRVLAKFNYHFGATKHVDWYVGGGFGINKTIESFKSDKPGYYFTPDYVPLFTFIPVSARINVGGKFYLSKNIGLGLEMGLFGGAPFTASLCSKF